VRDGPAVVNLRSSRPADDGHDAGKISFVVTLPHRIVRLAILPPRPLNSPSGPVPSRHGQVRQRAPFDALPAPQGHAVPVNNFGVKYILATFAALPVPGAGTERFPALVRLFPVNPFDEKNGCSD
jgi:hypothetical protein